MCDRRARLGGLIVAFSGNLVLASCSVIPDIPGDESLPVQDILQHASCELRGAFLELNEKKHSSFNAKNWQVAITITPKADREIIAGIGLTGKATAHPSVNHFGSWAVNSPGLQYDAKGTRNATVVYNASSKNIIDVKKYPLVCDQSTDSYSELTKHLGIREWLIRAVLAEEKSVGSLVSLDKPTFSSEIYVKYSGNGTFTYNFPLGTDIASLAGNYDTDETLSIALTSNPKSSTIVVQTLPTGGNFGDRPPDRIVVQTTVNVPTRLDALQTEQNIINALHGLQP